MAKRVPAKKKQKRKARPITRVLILAVMLVASGFFLWNVLQEGVTTYTLQVDISEAKAQITALKSEQDNLTHEKEKLSDENYVKNYARGEYMISKEGEQIFHLPNTNGEPDQKE